MIFINLVFTLVFLKLLHCFFADVLRINSDLFDVSYLSHVIIDEIKTVKS